MIHSKMIQSVLIALFFSLAAVPSSSAESVKDDVITDYEVAITAIEVIDRQAVSELSADHGAIQDVALKITGTAIVHGKRLDLIEIIDGVSVSAANIKGSRFYLLLGADDYQVFTVGCNAFSLGKDCRIGLGAIDADNVLIPHGDWKWTAKYREYRYSLKDRLAALAFGVLVKNSNDFYVELDPAY